MTKPLKGITFTAAEVASQAQAAYEYSVKRRGAAYAKAHHAAHVQPWTDGTTLVERTWIMAVVGLLRSLGAKVSR